VAQDEEVEDQLKISGLIFQARLVPIPSLKGQHTGLTFTIQAKKGDFRTKSPFFVSKI